MILSREELVGFFVGDGGIALRNNIASGMLYPLYIENPGTAASFTSDYNLWNGTSGYLAWGTAPTFLNYTNGKPPVTTRTVCWV